MSEAIEAYAHGLTAREQQCLQLAAEGRTNAEIAHALGISVETVKIHVKKALWQLNAISRTHAVAIALRAGAIT